jgi:hypothetical protein
MCRGYRQREAQQTKAWWGRPKVEEIRYSVGASERRAAALGCPGSGGAIYRHRALQQAGRGQDALEKTVRQRAASSGQRCTRDGEAAVRRATRREIARCTSSVPDDGGSQCLHGEAWHVGCDHK